MISFSLSEEQTVMKETLMNLVRNSLRDRAHDMDEKGEIPEERITEFRNLGTIISPIPEEYGGYGLPSSALMNAVILEELAFGDMGYAIAATLPSLFLNRFWPREQRVRRKSICPFMSPVNGPARWR